MAEERQVLFITGPELWQRGHGPDHPLKPDRLERTHRLLEHFGALEWSNLRTVEPRLAEREELALFHTEDYLQAVWELSQGSSQVEPWRYNFGPGDNPVFSGMYRSEGLKVGSALQAAAAIAEGEVDIAFSYSGGLHHAAPDRASGFCVFNDGAIAIRWLQQHFDRIFYLDIDVHHGDGVQDAFYQDPSVFTFSIHQDPRTLFPGTGYLRERGRGDGTGFCANLPLPAGTDDAHYLSAFRRTVLPLIDRFDPEVLVTQLGVDTHYHDPLAQLALTTEGHQALFEAVEALALPWLALGGGGYDLDVVPRSWSLAASVMAQRPLPAELPEEYRQRYGGRWLRDQAADGSPPPSTAEISKQIEQRTSSFRDLFDLKEAD